MKKIDEFCKVLDSLNNGEKNKLLTSAKGLIRAQKAVRISLTKPKLPNKRKSDEVKNNV